MFVNRSLNTVASPAYSPGDLVGSLITITGSDFQAPGYWNLNSVLVKDYSRQNAGGEILIFNDYPTRTTGTDNQPLVVERNDYSKICAVGSVLSNGFLNMSSYGIQLVDLKNQPVEAVGSSIYAMFQVRGTPTYVGNSAVELGFNFSKNT